MVLWLVNWSEEILPYEYTTNRKKTEVIISHVENIGDAYDNTI